MTLIQTDRLDQQADYLSSFIQTYTAHTQKSKQFAQQHRPVLADKTSIGFNFSLETKELCYPIVVDRAADAKLWDIDGNEYIDILMGLGINLFGHNPQFVQDAIAQQLAKGIQIGTQNQLAGEVAQLIHELTGMDRVAFSNTGTEAVMTAVRLARTATRRNKIAIFTNSYHGHFDAVLSRARLTEYAKKKLKRILEQQTHPLTKILAHPLQAALSLSLNPAAVPAAPGIPKSAVKDVLILEYGSPKSLEIIKAHRHQLAAVLVEPVQSRCTEIQPQAFLHQLRQLTSSLKVALIFDEMVTGFRVHPGGAQAWFEVEADLVTYSKIVGGGLPLSVIAGKSDYMDHIDGGFWSYGDRSIPATETTFFAGTFCKHPLSLAAARAVLMRLKAEGSSLQNALNQRTSHLVDRLNSDCRIKGIPIEFTSFGSFFTIANSRSQISEIAMSLLSYHLISRGIHLRQGDRGGFLSTAHTEAEIEQIFQAFQSSIAALASFL
jgi:glutamate-1-semialdehyde 2,1-aminomutase